MYNGLIMSIIAASAIIYSINLTLQKTEESMQAVKEAKILLNVQQGMVLQSKYTKNIVEDPYHTDIKLSELAIDETPKDSELLDKLQKATIQTVVNQHIENPTCNDLAKTNLITLQECNYIANKQQNYAV